MYYSITFSPQPGDKRCQPNQSGADVRPMVTVLHCGMEDYWIEGQENYILVLVPLGTSWVTL